MSSIDFKSAGYNSEKWNENIQKNEIFFYNTQKEFFFFRTTTFEKTCVLHSQSRQYYVYLIVKIKVRITFACYPKCRISVKI